MPPLEAKRSTPSRAPDVRIAPDESKHEGHDRYRGIRCPKCAWRPRAQDRWSCHCGHVWNTFDTAGRCPGCGFQWHDTACPRCQQWSKHLAWYESGTSPRS